MTIIQSKFVAVDGARTHYLEAGEGPTLVLLHSGEFGACAELTWEFNIEALARHFRVVAPDWLGFGETTKLFSFDDMWELRVQHIARFLQTLCIPRAHFMGNSMGGTVLIGTATRDDTPWPIDRMIIVSGGGNIPENEARRLLNSYDGTRAHMKKIVEAIFFNPSIRDNAAYIDRRHKLSLVKGSWECTAAVRFKAPWIEPSSSMPEPAPYHKIKVPTLLIAGAKDNLRAPNYAAPLQAAVPGSELHVIENGGHCPQIDAPAEFNRVVIDYLSRDRR